MALVYLAEFLKTFLKTGQKFRTGFAQVSGHCGEKKHRGPAVVVGLIVKLTPSANSPWVRKGPQCQSLGGRGAGKAWYCPLFLLWRTQCARHLCLKFDMSNSFNVWGPLANENIPLEHMLSWSGGESQVRATLREPCVRAEFLGNTYFSWVGLRCVVSRSQLVRFT